MIYFCIYVPTLPAFRHMPMLIVNYIHRLGGEFVLMMYDMVENLDDETKKISCISGF